MTLVPRRYCRICDELMLKGACQKHGYLADQADVAPLLDRCPAVSPGGARCTGNANHPGEHFDAQRGTAWSWSFGPARDVVVASLGAQTDAEIGAIVRAALNRYLNASVITHAGVTKRLTLDHVVSAEVSAVIGPRKVDLKFDLKIEFQPEWEVGG